MPFIELEQNISDLNEITNQPKKIFAELQNVTPLKHSRNADNNVLQSEIEEFENFLFGPEPVPDSSYSMETGRELRHSDLQNTLTSLPVENSNRSPNLQEEVEQIVQQDIDNVPGTINSSMEQNHQVDLEEPSASELSGE